MFISAVAMPNTAAAPSWRRVQPRHGWRDTSEQRDRRADDAEPGDGLRGDLVEQERRRSTRPMYWAIAERTNSASGEAVSR